MHGTGVLRQVTSALTTFRWKPCRLPVPLSYLVIRLNVDVRRMTVTGKVFACMVCSSGKVLRTNKGFRFTDSLEVSIKEYSEFDDERIRRTKEKRCA